MADLVRHHHGSTFRIGFASGDKFRPGSACGIERPGSCGVRAETRGSMTPIADMVEFSSWPKARAFVLDRDLFICSYCLDDANQVDHLMPVARMGHFLDPHNLTASCGPCNRSKGALTPQEWFERDWGGRAPPWFVERHG